MLFGDPGGSDHGDGLGGSGSAEGEDGHEAGRGGDADQPNYDPEAFCTELGMVENNWKFTKDGRVAGTLHFIAPRGGSLVSKLKATCEIHSTKDQVCSAWISFSGGVADMRKAQCLLIGWLDSGTTCSRAEHSEQSDAIARSYGRVPGKRRRA